MDNFVTGSQGSVEAGDDPGVRVPVTVAHGDGIGPEIMGAVLRVLDAAGARLDYETVEIGEKVYLKGVSAGIEQATWESLRRTGVMLKAPITTPQGKGFKSLNVTLRKSLGLFANVRPCRSYDPFIATRHPGTDVVIVRENEEDTYAGIEHRQTAEVTQCLKLITRPGTEKIVRYAFEYAKQQGRKRVTCFIKDNIMKITDGLFHRVFDRIAAEYPEIEADSQIIDIATARLAKDPTKYDVIVTLNLYGDIVSDVAAELTGSVGLGGSANIGEVASMFEAIHGSAPDIAGKGIANPSGLLHAAVMMLDHVGQPEVAQKIENAWLRAIEEGVRTGDMPGDREAVGTEAFAQAIIDRLGQRPERLPEQVHHARSGGMEMYKAKRGEKPVKELVGVDVFLDWDEADRSPEVLGKKLEAIAGPDLKLKMISNRGVKVYPEGLPETFCTDHWRCRFVHPEHPSVISHEKVIGLLQRLSAAGLDFIKTEHLCRFDGDLQYSLGQGE
ncbi:NADP-dependent isocitrate dehydrogenase [Mucisphaera sp.]|uniref:NADP-dependent isocitrate dehydrogenase n=1 Tax=Mucisphaera sp. TaxID=2913024 RepID=UPI003D10B6C7